MIWTDACACDEYDGACMDFCMTGRLPDGPCREYEVAAGVPLTAYRVGPSSGENPHISCVEDLYSEAGWQRVMARWNYNPQATLNTLTEKAAYGVEFGSSTLLDILASLPTNFFAATLRH